MTDDHALQWILDDRKRTRSASWLDFPDGVRALLPGHVCLARVAVSSGTCYVAWSLSGSFTVRTFFPVAVISVLTDARRFAGATPAKFSTAIASNGCRSDARSFGFQTKNPPGLLFRRSNYAAGCLLCADSTIINGAVTVNIINRWIRSQRCWQPGKHVPRTSATERVVWGMTTAFRRYGPSIIRVSFDQMENRNLAFEKYVWLLREHNLKGDANYFS